MTPRNISIHPVLNGFIVSCGCQTVVFRTPDELGVAIAAYYRDPARTEKEFIDKKVNDTMKNPDVVMGLQRECPTTQQQPECENAKTSLRR